MCLRERGRKGRKKEREKEGGGAAKRGLLIALLGGPLSFFFSLDFVCGLLDEFHGVNDCPFSLFLSRVSK